MPVWREKVMAYITHGDRLLVFRQPEFPEAGIQVPGGTLELGETPDEAVLREAFEETGLLDLVLVRCLGERVFDGRTRGRDELHHRHFYHLRCTGEPPETWGHAERLSSDGYPGPIAFELWWAPLDDVPELIAEMGALLPALRAMARVTSEGASDE
jgi:8-oxo-dGTP pyrophosphatase MutT (NUDIX family)